MIQLMINKLICSVLILNFFLFSLYSVGDKAKDFYIKILIFQGKKLTLKENRISFHDQKMVYGGKRYSLKNRINRFGVKKSQPILIKKSRYYGRMIAVRKKNQLMLVNQIPLETYLVGVVNKEISYSWPLESIKAQAVAARSYAVYHMIKNKEKDYHLGNTTQHQVFRGIHDIPTSIVDGVEKTRGTIMVYQGRPIITFFHASCGGQTEMAENVWKNEQGKSYPYLTSVRCDDCKTHPRYRWEYHIGRDALQKKLDRLVKGKKIRQISITRQSLSQRVMELALATSGGSRKITGNEFRIAVDPKNLSSTKFKLQKKNNRFYFKGYGFGHGVGLCQWGAKTRAEQGHSYKKILRFYYRGIELEKITRL